MFDWLVTYTDITPYFPDRDTPGMVFGLFMLAISLYAMSLGRMRLKTIREVQKSLASNSSGDSTTGSA